MEIILLLFAVCAVVILGYIVPGKYNEHFEREHGKSAVNSTMSFICAATVVFFLLNIDNTGSMWFWFSLILAVIAVAVTIGVAYSSALQASGEVPSACLAVLMQLLSVAGIAITILTILALILGDSGKKKKRRR